MPGPGTDDTSPAGTAGTLCGHSSDGGQARQLPPVATSARTGPGGADRGDHARVAPSLVVCRLASAAVATPCVLAVATAGELSVGALLAVGTAGALVTGLALARRSGEAAAPVGRRGLPWLGWLTVVVSWELVTLADDDVPTVSDLADPLLAHPVVRGGATVCWLAAGAWLLARPRRPRRTR